MNAMEPITPETRLKPNPEVLFSLVGDEAVTMEQEHFKLVSMMAHSETGEASFAKVVVGEATAEKRAEAQGDGPVDATFKAIETIVGSGAQLQLYSVNSITSGTDSQGEVTVRLKKDGRIVNGAGADTDIVVASAKAYINALNKLQSKAERVNPQV